MFLRGVRLDLVCHLSRVVKWLLKCRKEHLLRFSLRGTVLAWPTTWEHQQQRNNNGNSFKSSHTNLTAMFFIVKPFLFPLSIQTYAWIACWKHVWDFLSGLPNLGVSLNVSEVDLNWCWAGLAELEARVLLPWVMPWQCLWVPLQLGLCSAWEWQSLGFPPPNYYFLNITTESLQWGSFALGSLKPWKLGAHCTSLGNCRFLLHCFSASLLLCPSWLFDV